MKKILCVILLLATVFLLCSCGSEPESIPDPVEEEDYTEELYEKLSGVWVKQDGYTSTFMAISKENGEVTYSAGVPFSGFVFSGTVYEITKTGSIYFFAVHVPERKADELSDGWAEHDITVTVGVNRIGEHIINANDYAADGQPVDFTRFADSLDKADWEPLFEADEPVMEFDTALADEVWDRITGIWLCSAGGNSFFSEFTRDNESYCVSQGVPASGFMIGAVATFIEKTDSTYTIDFHIPERHDTGEGAEMDYDAFDVRTVLTVNGDGTLTFDIWVDSGETADWHFWAEDWDSVDWEAYFASLPEG